MNLSSYRLIVWPPFGNSLSDGVDVARMHTLWSMLAYMRWEFKRHFINDIILLAITVTSVRTWSLCLYQQTLADTFILSALRWVHTMEIVILLLTWLQCSPDSLNVMADESSKLQFWQKVVVRDQTADLPALMVWPWDSQYETPSPSPTVLYSIVMPS